MIGAACGTIIDALVKPILMPLVSVLLPGQQRSLEWKAVLHGTDIPCGLFRGEVVNVPMIAVVLFLCIVTCLGGLMHTQHTEATNPPPPTPEHVLLTEIWDLVQAGVHDNEERRV
jgi:large conductance mechanosensitive channel